MDLFYFLCPFNPKSKRHIQNLKPGCLRRIDDHSLLIMDNCSVFSEFNPMIDG